ncbi:hypothetical protein VP01_1500g1, partial [Puccinia sorghi]
CWVKFYYLSPLRTIQRHFLSYFLWPKDYLASSASSCAANTRPKQIFCSAANVCSSVHGSLNPHKIERNFEKPQKIVKNYLDFSQKTSKK